MSQLKRIREIVIAVVLLAIPFFVLNASLRDPSRQTALDRALLSVLAPAQAAGTWTARVFSEFVDDYVFLLEVREENERLQARVARLEAERHELLAEGLENRRLRSLLQLRERIGGELIAGEVIARDIAPPFFRVTRVALDRGTRDRVRPGMPVLSGQGLVGLVQRAGSRSCEVQLIVDRRTAVDVIIQRTGARGMLRGTGEDERYLARIQYLGREDALRVGDLVHTSGLGQRFPPSILVGRVTRIVREDFGLYQEVEVTPAVDFSRLEEVLVLTEGALGDVTAETRETGAGPARRP
ncbi:MAG: rod shape-determining protein MreC [Sandaracinaceae bacterium]